MPISPVRFHELYLICMLIFSKILNLIHCNDPKFSDRYAWANSADPDQTAPRGAV